MNDMIIVLRFEHYFRRKIRNGTSDTRNNYYFYKDRLKQLKKYFDFCYPNVPIPVVNDPALDRLNRIRPVISILQEKLETLYYPHKEISVGENMIPFKG